MNRDGLTEENLQSGETIRVSQREREERVLSKQAEDVSFSRSERDADQRSESGKRRQKPKNQPEMKQGEALSDSGGLRAEVSAGVDFDGLSGNLMAADRRDSLEMASAAAQETAPSGHSGIREQSFRSGNIRGHPSGTSAFLESAAETSHLRKKKLVQEYARKASGKPEDTAAMEDFREEIKEKTKREQLRKEQKKAGRLSFGDEESGMVRGAGMGISKGSFNSGRLRCCHVHGKAHEAEQENAAVEGTHRAELMAESALRYAMHRTSRGLHKRNARLQKPVPWKWEKPVFV